MKPCRECHHVISEQARTCPNCGAPFPAKENWNGYGYEFKSKAQLLGLPLLHISFKFKPNGKPVAARGIISIGMFGMGVINISQFGIGLFSLSQFTIAGYAVAQFAIAYSLVAQVGLYLNQGMGMFVVNFLDLIGKLF
ncbi:MAG: zinc ribbon domain-containing protein [Candidatus Marinimicrobia bacterium]|nr:zinc ribbon domain-containing protein [Candidatus Neomarinimicrobiota bacterium]